MRRFAAVTMSVSALVLTLGVIEPASADHTDPRVPLAPTDGATETGITRGDGVWQHIANFPGLAGPQLTGGGTDLEFFSPQGSDDIFGAFGTLGQDDAGSIGQRIIRLTRKGQVRPTWVADHGSAHCEANASTTSMQHDSQVSVLNRVRLLTDTTDATGRCHDTGGGGIEIVNVSTMANPNFKPREAHLVRFAGTSHTHTADPQRPGIIYNSSSEFANRNWVDVMDMRSCFGTVKWTDAQRRNECRPLVYRINFQPEWTMQRDQTTGELEPGSATCHDITYFRGRLYCAALNATLIIDTSNLFQADGDVKGTPFPCPVVAGTRTGAKVTDCSGMGGTRTETANGWQFLGTYQHPGRDCGPPGTDVRTCNSNNQVRSDEGVSVAHEADPTPDEQFMFVTDERGGGVVPPGSSCTPGIENPYGNGGAHAFDISNPANIRYATTPGGERSVYISDAVVPASTFCDVHVIEQIPGEQRFIAAYYTQGIKIVDYFVDADGHLTFEERSSFTLPDANTWTAEDFKTQTNADGTKTYFIAVNDIHRGIDVVSWRGEPNPMGAEPRPASSGTAATNAGLAGGSVLLLLLAAGYRRWQRGRELEAA
ncbi:MAG: hypothetical protein M3353_09470 [Actinomycetota bacterium]|nr:hypothetical protein [Actinomycetota bacterium]